MNSTVTQAEGAGSRLSTRWKVVLAFLVLAGVIAIAAYTFLRPTPAPQVTFVTLKGEKITTHDLLGKVVWVDFWATDCPGCVKETPDLIKMYNTFHARGFELMRVDMKYDRPDYVINFQKKYKQPFNVVLDPLGKIEAAFGNVMLNPTSFLIDKKGMIVSRFVGEPDFKAVYVLIERELAQ
jgi:peroxiredoxin